MTAAESRNRPRPRADVIVFALIAVVAIAVVAYVSSQRQQVLRASQVGFDGLQIWLTKSDLPAQTFTGGWTIDRGTVDLLVLPLFDTELDALRDRPGTKEELLMQQDVSDQLSSVLRAKTELVPSMVILPKWRSAVRLTGQAHPDLLVDMSRVSDVLTDITGADMGLRRLSTAMTEFEYVSPLGEDWQASLYVAQVFDGQGCQPVLGKVGQMILGSCPVDGGRDRVLVLSDPDLLNNHGLRLGDNALIARDIFSSVTSQGQILIDYSAQNWIVERAQTTARSRTWADILRFFEPPFLAMWISAAIILLLLIWRAGLRYGPVIGEGTSMGASKFKTIAAQARLLRLTDQDGALLSEYAEARMSSVVTTLFGPAQTRSGRDRDLLLNHLRRHSPDTASRLTDLLATLDRLPPHLNAREAIGYVDAFETTLEMITHDT